MTGTGEPNERAAPSGLYGRRKGKKLRTRHINLMAELLPLLQIDTGAEIFEPRGDPEFRSAAVCLEIGFGGGEHLAAQAKAHPEIAFIGCEPFLNGVAKLLAEIDTDRLANIRIHPDDAAVLMRKLPAASIDRAYILFPDPWPKRRHRDRRFFNEANLNEFARILKPGAELRFATDVDDYAGWALARILASNEFAWSGTSMANWSAPWPGHHVTRYEGKALAKGVKPAYLTFVRTARGG